MMTLCPGVECPRAPDCERNVRFRRRYAYPHACTFPVDKQPGGRVKIQQTIEGVLLPPVPMFVCEEFVAREAPQP